MKAKRLICLATAAVMTASMAAVFAGCGEEKVTVEWMTSARDVMKTDSIKKGSKVEDWTPSAAQTPEGKAFGGWYEEASYGTKYNFNTEINEDTRIYAQWVNTTVETDTRMWYIMGNGTGDLKENNYAFATVPNMDEDETVILDENGYATFSVVKGMEKYLLTKAPDKNDYSIVVTLYKGATFQMATNITASNWTGDAGFARASFGNIEGAEWDADETSSTGLSSTKGHVNDENGRTIFTTTKEFGDDWCQWPTTCNINAQFKLTIHTYPGEDATRNTISWEILEDFGEIEVTNAVYLMGAFCNWTETEEYKLAADATGEEFTGYLNVPAAGVEMKLKSSFNEWVAPDYFEKASEADGANAFVPEGLYKFTVTFDADNKMVIEVEEVENLDFYVVGTFVDENNALQNFTLVEGLTPKFELATATTMTATVTVVDAVSIIGSGLSWVTEQGGANAIFALKPAEVVNGSINWQSEIAGSFGNYFITEGAGDYTITLNLVAHTFSVEKVEVAE